MADKEVDGEASSSDEEAPAAPVWRQEKSAPTKATRANSRRSFSADSALDHEASKSQAAAKRVLDRRPSHFAEVSQAKSAPIKKARSNSRRSFSADVARDHEASESQGVDLEAQPAAQIEVTPIQRRASRPAVLAASEKSLSDDRLVKICADLDEQHKRAGRARRGITLLLTIVGLVLWPIGLVTGLLRVAQLIPPEVGHDGFHFGYALPGLFCVMVALQPTDNKLIFYSSYFFLFYLGGAGLLGVAVVTIAIIGEDAELFPARSDSQRVADALHWGGVISCCLAATVAWLRMIICAKLSPRAKLMHQWSIMRAAYLGFGIFTWLYIIIFSAVEPTFFRSVSFWGSVAHATADVVCTVITTRPRRRRFTRFLMRLTGDRDDNAAAGIAAMVGGVGLEKAGIMAEKTFRAISQERMQYNDFLHGDLASPNDDLRGRTVPCQLGFVDAFMSHSWRDDAEAKWHSLCLWSDAWREAHQNRNPMLWFDRACLDQEDIDASLAMLPIYLSGCKVLLILAGETYSTRLWCVMEVFTWLSVGKNSANLISVQPLVKPQGSPDTKRMTWARAALATQEQNKSLEKAQAQFISFKAANAQCFKPEDRDRLLAIVERAFGTFDDFDKRVRAALLRQSKASLAGTFKLSSELSTKYGGNVLHVNEVAAIISERSLPHQP